MYLLSGGVLFVYYHRARHYFVSLRQGLAIMLALEFWASRVLPTSAMCAEARHTSLSGCFLSAAGLGWPAMLWNSCASALPVH